MIEFKYGLLVGIFAYIYAPCQAIIGGQEVEIEEYPFHLALRNSTNETFCGATLIHPEWALTSASCIIKGYRNNLTVRAGDNNNNTNDSQTHHIIQVIRYIVHHKFYILETEYDIALLQLNEPLPENIAQPVNYPDPDYELPDNAVATIVGWGKTAENATNFSTSLQMISLPLLDHDKCEMDYMTKYPVMENMICFGSENSSIGLCDGDFGGSATIGGVIYGIASYSEGCAQTHLPAVFTKVSDFLPWIESNMKSQEL